MKWNKWARPNGLKLKPLQWIIAALCLLLVLNCTLLISVLVDEFTGYKMSETSILYSLRGGDYAWMRYDFAYYTADEIAQNETINACYSTMLYFESNVYYNAYTATGDAEQAAYYDAARQEYAQQMGDLAFYAAEIDALFE